MRFEEREEDEELGSAAFRAIVRIVVTVAPEKVNGRDYVGVVSSLVHKSLRRVTQERVVARIVLRENVWSVLEARHCLGRRYRRVPAIVRKHVVLASPYDRVILLFEVLEEVGLPFVQEGPKRPMTTNMRVATPVPRGRYPFR